jgi:UDP-N-acetylglucosamine 2-epimerase (non-hydrolysing)
MTHRVLVIIGTRPEAIKMAPVVAALRAAGPELEVRVVLTGQHTLLVDQVVATFQLEPDYSLNIMQAGQTLYDVIQRALDGLRKVAQEFQPEVVLVQGDTATVFVGALVGFLERARVGHVEAGLRSHDKWAPFPEEVFRRLSDVLSDFYFAPTALARDHLLAEGVPSDRIHVTGNTGIDALLTVATQYRAVESKALDRVLQGRGRLVLLTAHRRESFGHPLREVFTAVRSLVEEFADIELVYPVHPNPNVRGPAQELLADHPRIHLTEPLSYSDLAAALKAAVLVLTDSGGIQEEAPSFGASTLVLRDVTERPEGVRAGVAHLVGTDRERILTLARKVLLESDSRPSPPSPYGDGNAAGRIADIIVASLTGRSRTTKDWDGG